MPNRDGPRARTHPAMTAEHERWIKDQQRAIPKVPQATAAASTGLDVFSAQGTVSVVSGGIGVTTLGGADVVWTGETGATASGGTLTLPDGGWQVTVHTTVTAPTAAPGDPLRVFVSGDTVIGWWSGVSLSGTDELTVCGAGNAGDLTVFVYAMSGSPGETLTASFSALGFRFY